MLSIPLTRAGFVAADILDIPVTAPTDGGPDTRIAVLRDRDGQTCVARVCECPADPTGWAYIPGEGRALDRLVRSIVNRSRMMAGPALVGVESYTRRPAADGGDYADPTHPYHGNPQAQGERNRRKRTEAARDAVAAHLRAAVAEIAAATGESTLAVRKRLGAAVAPVGGGQ